MRWRAAASAAAWAAGNRRQAPCHAEIVGPVRRVPPVVVLAAERTAAVARHRRAAPIDVQEPRLSICANRVRGVVRAGGGVQVA